GGGEAGVLPDCPRLARVHGGAWPAHERIDARETVGEVQVGDVGGGPERLHVDALRRVPHEPVGVGALALLGRELAPPLRVRRIPRGGHRRHCETFVSSVQPDGWWVAVAPRAGSFSARARTSCINGWSPAGCNASDGRGYADP